MKPFFSLFSSVVAIAACSLAPGSASGELFTADAMQKLPRDTRLSGALMPVELQAMRNEHEAFQVIFQAGSAAIDTAKVTVSELKSAAGDVIASEAVTMRKAHYILCDKHVKRPAYWPDALPLYRGETFSVPANCQQSIYIDVAVPAETPAGTYTATIDAEEDGVARSTTLTLRVRNVTLPATPSFQSAFPIWGGEQLVAPYPGMEPGTPEYRELYERFYWFMVGYRMPPDDLPVELDSPEAERYLRHPAVNSFRIPYDPAKPERFQQICAALREQGLLERGYVYTLDEPSRDQYESCKKYAERIHELAPDVRYLLTLNNGNSPQLEGSIDIWCPILAGYDPKYFQPLQAKQDNVWWYTCVYPQQPYPTYLINDEGISPRMLSWLQAKYKVEGVLYWALNIWKKWNPDLLRYEPRDIWNDPLAFPAANGDGYLVYPAPTPQEEPIPSWRLEMLRQGNEDFDMLSLLRQAVDAQAAELQWPDYNGAERVTELASRIARSLIQFDHDPTALNTLRLDVLDELEALTHGPAALWRATVPEGELVAPKLVQWQLRSAPGSQVTIEAATASRSWQIQPELTDGALVWSLLLEEPVTLTATVTKDGKVARYKRVYLPRRPSGKTEEVFNWSMDQIADRLNCQQVTLRTVPGSVLREFVFDTATDFPNVRLKLDGDTRAYRWIIVKAINYGADEASAMLKYHSPVGARDGAPLNIPATGTPVTLAFPFNPESATAEEAFDELEIWMFKGRKIDALTIESITLSADRPEADNLD